MRASQISEGDDLDALAPLFDGEEIAGRTSRCCARCASSRSPTAPTWRHYVKQALDVNPRLVVCVRAPFTADAGERLLRLYEAGIRVVHLCADEYGREVDTAEPRYLRDALREAHGRLVQAGHSRRGDAHRRRRHRAGGAHGEGDHLRRGPGGRRRAAARRPRLPRLRRRSRRRTARCRSRRSTRTTRRSEW